MLAVQFSEHGAAEVLQLIDLPTPNRGPARC